MPTTVQFRRGTTAQNDAFTGAAGELSIDTDKKAIRIHDNSTAGGEEVVVVSSTQTLTNKTLTSAVLNTGVSGSAVLDEDDMSSNSATQLATQQSIKAYVDSQVTAQDLDVTSDSGTIAIDLDSETLTIAGGTGIDSSATTNTVTLAIDSTVTTLTGTQTLTNKTLTSPTINSATIAMGTNKITGMGDPVSAQDAATKAYVDGELSSLSSNSLTQGDTNWTITDIGTGSIVATVDNTTHSTFAAAGITLAQGNFVGNLTGNASGSAATLATARAIALTGDVTGSANFDGSAGISIAATIAANSVALGTDTTGNYMAGVSAGSGISVSHTPGEGSTATVSHADTSSVSSLTALTGANVVSDLDFDTYGHVTLVSTRAMTLADLGYSGATNANYITNNNQLTNGAGYTTNTGDITNVAVSGTGLSGGGASGSVTITSNATSANTGSTIVARDGSGNFSAGVITATTTAARYADLAERYTADADYEAGTVLVFGGEAEVTQSANKYDKRIAGIVSTDPAFLMNESLEDGVSVGLVGRLPCKVVGEIRKGDLMVASDTAGHAEAWRDESNPPAGSVIGKALENKTGAGADVIEVVVGKI